MAQMGAQILPARLTTEDGVKDLARRPVGSGAYRFVEWVKDERLVMEANREWWGWEGKAPAIDRVVWKPIPEDFPRIVALEKGEADIITNVPPDRIKSIADGRATQILSTPSSRIAILSINSTQPPLSDKRARQALHYALDVPSIIRNLYAGQAKPFSGGVADTDFGYNASLKAYPFDPAKAKQLLADAGRPSGIDVSLHAGSGTMVNDKFLLETIADMWAKVGIRARIDIMEMGARQRMLNERSVPAERPAPGQPAVDASRRGRKPLALVASERIQRQVLGRQPARPALSRSDGAGAIFARSRQAPHLVHRGDADHPRGQAVARAVPGDHRLRREPACRVQTASRLSADRGGDGA